ncbi:MAG TPA: hypothetical protein VFZ34_09070 [Blastocatellia bacterium]|nr:hypothetical protein [Blastocatellia bacterium]
MKKYLVTGAALSLAMLISLTTSHATTHKQATATALDAQEASSPGQMGKVVTVDTAKNEVSVKDDKGAEKTMSISPTTKITKDGKDIALSDLKAGDRVVYELDSASNPPVAKSLVVMPAKPAKP